MHIPVYLTSVFTKYDCYTAELSAAAVLINYWNKDTSLNPAWITIFLVVTIVINMFGAGVYGECEFIFAYVLAFNIALPIC